MTGRRSNQLNYAPVGRRIVAAASGSGWTTARGAGERCSRANLEECRPFDLIAVALIVLTSLSGFRRGLVVGVFSLAGLAIGFYLGARVGPSLVGGDLARWLPLVALGGAMVCAAIGQAVGSLAGRHLRQAARRARPAAALRQRRRRRARCRHRARALLGRRRGAPLSPAPDRAAPLRPGLGDPLPPQPGAAAAPADRHARADRPVRRARRPGRRSRAAGSGRARLGRREQCGTERRAGRRQRLRARDRGLGLDRRATGSSSPTPTSLPESTRRTSTATTATCSTRRSSRSTRPTTSPCSGSPGSTRRR